ncbi:FAD dependent oxidoreductase [Syncephalastrum racemosum]|uniref:L-2-hydroxyglutarate dehydrogenase, mitochondrial n=1 Tax=Syncephalastrum racemosum TaxID=13706 RepID=A0A1X2HVE3_SYNRA|nr:FAD dependent oxidoreductase [Syncephalastrum racemosum]
MTIDNLVIGAGVVGLAIGEKLTRARSNETTFVIDKHSRCGEETSSRNSEVIHAGIYYPPDSLKTRLCIQGNRMLYAFCEKHAIPHKRVGKLVVAQSPDQESYLANLHQKAIGLGVETRLLTGQEARALEPNVTSHAALLSPSTGIVDTHSLMDCLEQRILDQGGDVGLCTALVGLESAPGGYLVDLVTQPDQRTRVLAKRVFNAAGLHADKVANHIIPGRYKLHYARGHYYAYRGPSLGIQRLVYPCPRPNLAGLGTHLTLDMAGKIKFGPDVHYVDNPNDYNIPDDPAEAAAFAAAVQDFLPSVRAEQLHPDYAGIRPKLAGPGEPFRDFVITEEPDHKNLFTLIGIESPGLTSSLAIAEYVHNLIE